MDSKVMIGLLVLAISMICSAIWVGLIVFGLTDKPPLGLGFETWMFLSIALAAIGVLLLGLGV